MSEARDDHVEFTVIGTAAPVVAPGGVIPERGVDTRHRHNSHWRFYALLSPKATRMLYRSNYVCARPV